jgi:hypothetical protein
VDKLSVLKDRPTHNFSDWLGNYDAKVFKTFGESRQTTYECLEQVLEDEGYNKWKTWTELLKRRIGVLQEVV